jgi:hypothetical protein
MRAACHTCASSSIASAARGSRSTARQGPLRGPQVAALGGLGQQRLAEAGVGARGVDLLLGEAGELAQGGHLVAGVHRHAGARDLDLDAPRQQAIGARQPRVGLLEAALLDQREALQIRDPRVVLRQLGERGRLAITSPSTSSAQAW